MKSGILTLCEYASEHNGRLSIIDTFDVLAAKKFPWRAYFSIAALIDISDYKGVYDTISLNIFPSADIKQSIFEATSPFNKSSETNKVSVVAGLKGLIFEHEGDYTLQINLDDTPIAELPFKVILKEDE